MTQNKRIILNTIATYGRSMIGVLCGIFSTRWVLEALGHVDFGLYGLVGSLVIFVAFINIQFSTAIARYYAFAIGEAKVATDKNYALNETRSWFTVAVLIHLILPTILVGIGYPIGSYAITNGLLNIPSDRIDVCLWLWRFACLSCFIGMMSVPFQAMYTAKQYIAELTIYSLLQTIIKTAFIYYMVCNPGDWLWGYGLGMFFVTIIPPLLICVRAYCVFPECRLVFKALREKWRIGKLGSFAFWQGTGGVGFIASHQLMSVIVNQYFGARITGSFAVSQTVAAESASLTGALQGAFAPAITTACGANDYEQMRKMAFRVCKIGTFLTLLFALPMALEIDNLLLVWLKNPPPMASELCIATLIFIVIEKLSSGHITAVNATGKVAKFQTVRGLLRTSVALLALILIWFTHSVVAMSIALPISALIVVLGDVYLAQTRAGLSIQYWIKRVVLPIMAIVLITVLIGFLPRVIFSNPWLRLLFTSAISVVVMLFLGWFFLLDSDEKIFILKKFKRRSK